MTDLVPLRELIRNQTARGHTEDIERISPTTDRDNLFESVIVRASLPYTPIDIALCFNLLGVRAIQARPMAAPVVSHFPKRYTERLGSLLQMDITPTRCKPFRAEMERDRARAARNVSKLKAPEWANVLGLTTRQCALIQRDRHMRVANTSDKAPRKRKTRSGAIGANSPRSTHTPKCRLIDGVTKSAVNNAANMGDTYCRQDVDSCAEMTRIRQMFGGENLRMWSVDFSHAYKTIALPPDSTGVAYETIQVKDSGPTIRA